MLSFCVRRSNCEGWREEKGFGFRALDRGFDVEVRVPGRGFRI